MKEDEEIEVEAVQVMKKSLKLRTVSDIWSEAGRAAANLTFSLFRLSGAWPVVSGHPGVL